MPDKKVLAVLFLSLFLMMLSVGIIIPNIAYRAEELGASPFRIGLLFTLYSLFQFLFAPLWGYLSDRVGRKPILLAGLLGNGLGLLLFGLSHTLPYLYAARGISGLMSAAALPTAMAYIADVTDEDHRGRAMGLMGAAMGLGFIFGPGIGGALATFGHATPFLIAGLVNILTCCLAALLLRWSRPPAGATETYRPPSLAAAFRSPLLPYFGIAFCVPFAMAALETTFPLYIEERFGYGARDMGIMFLFMGTAVFLVQAFLLGRWIGYAGEPGVMIWGLLINAVGFVLVILSMGRVSLTAALLVSGVGNQVMRPANASLITKRTRMGQGVSIGLMDAFDSLGRILGPIMAGLLYAPHRSYPYLAAAAVLFVAAIVLQVGRRRAAGKVSSQETV